jgi:hypothetical protein
MRYLLASEVAEKRTTLHPRLLDLSTYLVAATFPIRTEDIEMMCDPH